MLNKLRFLTCLNFADSSSGTKAIRMQVGLLLARSTNHCILDLQINLLSECSMNLLQAIRFLSEGVRHVCLQTKTDLTWSKLSAKRGFWHIYTHLYVSIALSGHRPFIGLSPGYDSGALQACTLCSKALETL